MPSPSWRTVPTSERSVSTSYCSIRCLRIDVISSGRSFKSAPCLKRLARLPAWDGPVAVGRVSVWGRVVDEAEGWRGQFAYPYAVELFGGDRELALALRQRYCVDVDLA